MDTSLNGSYTTASGSNTQRVKAQKENAGFAWLTSAWRKRGFFHLRLQCLKVMTIV